MRILARAVWAARRMPAIALLSVPALAFAQFSFVEVASFPAGPEPSGMAVADLNEDGLKDLIVANDEPLVSVVLADSALRFLSPVAYTTTAGSRAGHRPQSIATGDFNGDGHVDFAVTNEYGSFFVSVFLGAGDGTFLPEAAYQTGACPVSVAAVDVNDDNTLDLVTANFDDKSVSVLLGVGDGSFLPRTDIPSLKRGTSIITADFNADGNADFAITERDTDTLVVLSGLGNAQFGPATPWSLGGFPWDGSPWSVTAGDFDRDGNLDVATANSAGDAVSVLLGLGDGTFSPPGIIVVIPNGVDASPNSIITADLNDDGILDLVVAVFAAGTIDLFRGNGDGIFELAQTVMVGASPSTIAAADFNGDGRMDLAVLDYYGETVSLLLADDIFTGTFDQGT